MKPMTTFEAVQELVQQGLRDQGTVPGYRRAMRACAKLGLSAAETSEILEMLAFTDKDGVPWQWLQKKLDREAERKAAKKATRQPPRD